MKTLYLHVGMTKTGSTSIETTFHEGRDVLLGAGVNYLDMGQNHSKIMLVVARKAAKGLKGDVTRQLGLEKGTTEYDPEVVIGTVERKLAECTSPKMVISGQGLLSNSPEEVGEIRRFVSSYFDTLKVIVYVREPCGWANSRAQENIKRGQTVKALIEGVREAPGTSPIVPKYRDIEAYIDHFGRENVDIRPFCRERFPKGDVISDFCLAIDEPLALAEHLPLTMSNESASHEALLLIQAHYDVITRRALAEAEEEPDPDLRRKKVKRAAIRQPSLNFPFREAVRSVRGTKFSLPAETLAEIRRACESDVAWLRSLTGDASLFEEPSLETRHSAPAWEIDTLHDLARVIESGIGDRMLVENRRRKRPAPGNIAVRLFQRAAEALRH